MITNEDLLKEISQTELTQLSDLNSADELNQEVIDDALNDAISFIESFILIPEDEPTPLLKKIVCDMTIYELRRKNDLLSDQDKELKKENEAYLNKMSIGKLRTKKLNNSTASVPVENTSFAFRHRNKKRVKTAGFR